MQGWRYAFSLPAAAVEAATPPGTVPLVEHSINLQRLRGKHVDRVAKYPLPTSDPADPLNWPTWRKVVCMTTVAYYAFVANFISASIAPALPLWNLSFPRDPRPVKELTGFVAFNVLMIGLGNIFWVPLAHIFGRRPVLVLSTITLFVATACGTTMQGYNTTLLIRIFQGLGSSTSETVTPAVVGDLFFVHERGAWMAFYTGSLASGSVIGGITGGYIAGRLGWLKLFWVGAALAGLACLCTLFLVPETIYDRGKQPLPIQTTLPRASHPQPIRYPTPASPPILSLNTLPSFRLTLPSRFKLSGILSIPEAPTLTFFFDDSSGDLISSSGAAAAAPPGIPKPEPRFFRRNNNINSPTAAGANPAAEPTSFFSFSSPSAFSSSSSPLTFLRSLKFGTYRGNALYQFKKPWFTLYLPSTWVIMLQYGGLVGAVTVISTVGPELLSQPPYQWGENAGLLFVGALVGILLGALCTGLMADRRLMRQAKDQSQGYAEPESRVPVMAPSLAVGTCGLLVFGLCAHYPGRHQWVGLQFAYGMVAFALAQVPSIWFNYLIDAYGQLASDCFVMICILRGLIPFAWTFFVIQWVQSQGYLVPFGVFTAIMGVFSLLSLPVVYWGKRMRIATAGYVVSNQ
ncbi:hypothetical protein VTK26DRAFT_9136 [Humicola hyalothermophila]